MVRKNDVDLRAYDLSMDLYHHLPETSAGYLNEKSLGDMMLAGRSLLYAGGAGSCMGCGEATAVRLMLAATGFVYGAEQMGIVAATGCNTVFGSTYPFTPSPCRGPTRCLRTPRPTPWGFACAGDRKSVV